MKRIQCIIRPLKLDEVKMALSEAGVVGMTVTDVRGCGSHAEARESFRGADYTVYLPPKVQIDMVVCDDAVDAIIETLLHFARTGEPGDGKIFIIPVLDSIRVRTEERGDIVL